MRVIIAILGKAKVSGTSIEEARRSTRNIIFPLSSFLPGVHSINAGNLFKIGDHLKTGKCLGRSENIYQCSCMKVVLPSREF